jgi:hypothetical protein
VDTQCSEPSGIERRSRITTAAAAATERSVGIRITWLRLSHSIDVPTMKLTADDKIPSKFEL